MVGPLFQLVARIKQNKQVYKVGEAATQTSLLSMIKRLSRFVYSAIHSFSYLELLSQNDNYHEQCLLTVLIDLIPAFTVKEKVSLQLQSCTILHRWHDAI